MTDEHARDHRGRFGFVTDCEVFAGADDPRGHILMQVDTRTYRRASPSFRIRRFCGGPLIVYQ